MRCSWATSVFTCTGLNRPTRIICAIPRASLRSVLLICCAVSKAFMCRVSTQITGSSAVVNPLTSHCDSGPASIPIRPKDTPSEVRTAMISAGSVGIFPLQDHLAGIVDHAHRCCLYRYVQTREMDHVIAPSSRIEVCRPQIHYRQRKGTRTRCVPRPPRYTICRFSRGTFARTRGNGRDAPIPAVPPERLTANELSYFSWL